MNELTSCFENDLEPCLPRRASGADARSSLPRGTSTNVEATAIAATFPARRATSISTFAYPRRRLHLPTLPRWTRRRAAPAGRHVKTRAASHARSRRKVTCSMRARPPRANHSATSSELPDSRSVNPSGLPFRSPARLPMPRRLRTREQSQMRLPMPDLRRPMLAAPISFRHRFT